MIIHESDNLIVTDNVLTNLPISRLSSIPVDVDGISPVDLLLISKPCDPERMTETGYMSYRATMAELSSFAYSALDIDGITADIHNVRTSVDLLWPFYGMLCDISNSQPSAVVDIYDNGRFDPRVISAVYASKGTILTSLGTYKFSDSMSNIFDWKKFYSISASFGYFDNLVGGDIHLDSVYAEDGIFKNLSATNRLSAAHLTATTGNIPGLTAGTVNVTNKITASQGVFTGLTATNMSASHLTADVGNIRNESVTSLTAVSADVTNLTVDGQPYQHLSVMSQSAYNQAAKQPNYFYFTYPG